jgi:hypothetical protein
MVALAIAVFTAGPALAQPQSPIRYRAASPTEKFPLPTDSLISPAAPVPARTSYQPGPQDDPNVTLPGGTQIPLPQGKPRRISWQPRYGIRGTIIHDKLPDGAERSLFTGGWIINGTTDGGEEIELATDNAVVWRRGAVQNTPDGFQTGGDGNAEMEFYLSGNVIVRTKSDKSPLQVLRASEVYYDVERERAVAVTAALEFTPRFAPDAFHIRGREVWRLDAENWEAHDASFDSSKLPSDPGLKIDSGRVTYNERQVRLRNFFGLPYRDLLTGEPIYGDERTVTAYGAVPKVMGVPVWYWPRVRTDANDPLGPFVGMGFGQNRVFGTQVYTTWDIFDLFALRPPPGHRWRLNADYLSKRGPALGTDYLYKLPGSTPGMWGSEGTIKLYGIHDQGVDVLGGNRGPEPIPPEFRGRAGWRHQQEILEGLYFQGQVAYLSDKNFLEQYYKNEFDLGPNQETFAYLSWNAGNWWASGLANVRLERPWVPETQWIPRLDGALIGRSFFDLFVYDARANAGYALARRTDINPVSLLATDQNIDTGRIDLIQELSLPFSLGPVKLAPYGMFDLTGYTDDLTGNSAGRVWGGGGSRASLPFSRLYEGAASDLFNVRGLYHKAVLGANYLYARSTIPYTQLPMLDRLNDDATDQAWRNITPFQPELVSGPNGFLLQDAPDPLSPFNPQRYVIRRLVQNRVDTLDDINVLQLDLRQRLQTKRGYPGLEHTVDLVTLSTSVSYFPEAARDNFGHPFAFLEYDFLWNVGDRTALSTTGWFEPYDEGSKYFTFGSYFNRPDRTLFYLGYRQIDPVNSRAVLGSVGYQLSNRYFLNAGVSYDFGINQALSNSLTLTRTGTDLTVAIGFTYNSLVNNFGFQFLVVPNIVNSVAGGRFAGTPLGTQAMNRGQR